MNLKEQKELLEKALLIAELIEKEEYYIKSLEELLDSRTDELYNGQLEYDQAKVNTMKRASKRLKESFDKIIKQLN
tara:strand:- start:43 stop:270 length:228 start_codon:yes stop_codon:yes gene_type:complete